MTDAELPVLLRAGALLMQRVGRRGWRRAEDLVAGRGLAIWFHPPAGAAGPHLQLVRAVNAAQLSWLPAALPICFSSCLWLPGLAGLGQLGEHLVEQLMAFRMRG
jgi:hypothetical protein